MLHCRFISQTQEVPWIQNKQHYQEMVELSLFSAKSVSQSGSGILQFLGRLAIKAELQFHTALILKIKLVWLSLDG